MATIKVCAFRYANAEQAQQVASRADRLAKIGKITTLSGTTAFKGSDGTVRFGGLTNWGAESIAWWAGFWGMAIGWVVAGPLAALLGGVGLGSMLGRGVGMIVDRTSDHLGPDALQSVVNRLNTGESALFIAADAKHMQTVVNQLKKFGGTVTLFDAVQDAPSQAVQTKPKMCTY